MAVKNLLTFKGVGGPARKPPPPPHPHPKTKFCLLNQLTLDWEPGEAKYFARYIHTEPVIHSPITWSKMRISGLIKEGWCQSL